GVRRRGRRPRTVTPGSAWHPSTRLTDPGRRGNSHQVRTWRMGGRSSSTFQVISLAERTRRGYRCPITTRGKGQNGALLPRVRAVPLPAPALPQHHRVADLRIRFHRHDGLDFHLELELRRHGSLARRAGHVRLRSLVQYDAVPD